MKRLPNTIKSSFYHVSNPVYFFKIFEIFPELKDKQKIDFLLDIHSQASLFLVCQLLTDKSMRNKISAKEYCMFNNPVYKKTVISKIVGTSETDKLSRMIILNNINPVSEREKNDLELLMAEGFDRFQRTINRRIAKNSRRKG